MVVQGFRGWHGLFVHPFFRFDMCTTEPTRSLQAMKPQAFAPRELHCQLHKSYLKCKTLNPEPNQHVNLNLLSLPLKVGTEVHAQMEHLQTKF